jgi:TonB family protein
MKIFCQRFPVFFFFFALCVLNTAAQQKTLAIIRTDKNETTRELAAILENSLEDSFKFSDPDLTEQAVNSAAFSASTDSASEKNLFNLSLESARNIGIGIGCDLYVVLRSENLRRSSSKKDSYYEAYLVAFFINARTGRLLAWKDLSTETDDAASAGKALLADKALLSDFAKYARDIPEILKNSLLAEQKDTFDGSVYRIAGDGEQGLRTPLPFQRLSPVSTAAAQHLRVEAVVDIEAAIDAKGYVTGTRILRWGGFGLDESVTETVRKMNFRPAILDGKAIPARFLLRYNFRVPVENKSK